MVGSVSLEILMNENTPQNVSKQSDDDGIGIIKVLVYLKSKCKFLLVFLFLGIAFAAAALLQTPQVCKVSDGGLIAHETAGFGALDVLEQGGEVLLTGSVRDTYLKQNIEMHSANTGFYTNLLNDVQQLCVVLASEVGPKLNFVVCMFVLGLLLAYKGLRCGYLLKYSPKGLCEMLKNGTFSDRLVVKLIDYFYVLRANARVVNPGCLLNSFRFNAFLDLFKDKYVAHITKSIQNAMNVFDRISEVPLLKALVFNKCERFAEYGYGSSGYYGNHRNY